MEAPCSDPPRDLVARQAKTKQLSPSDHPVLPRRERPNFPCGVAFKAHSPKKLATG
jgi:hypothetical protein